MKKKKKKKSKKKQSKTHKSINLRTAISRLKIELLNDKHLESKTRLSTGVLPLDLILTDDGGLRGGGCMEMYGPEGVGKTSLVLSVIRSAKETGMPSMLIDVEFALNSEQCNIFSLEANKDFLLIQPDDAEAALDGAEMFLRSSPKSLLIIDSIAALMSSSEWEEKAGDKSYNPVLLMLSKFAKKAPKLCRKSDSIVIYINQIRANMKNRGPDIRTPGPYAIRFHTAWRASMWPASKLSESKEGDVIGHKVSFQTVKNKFARPYQKTESNLIYGRGFHQGYDIVEMIKMYGLKKLIDINESWYTFYNGKKMQGISNAADYIVENAEIYDALHNGIMEVLKIEI